MFWAYVIERVAYTEAPCSRVSNIDSLLGHHLAFELFNTLLAMCDVDARFYPEDGFCRSKNVH